MRIKKVHTCQKLTWQDTSEDGDNHLDTANNGCMIFPKEHCRSDHRCTKLKKYHPLLKPKTTIQYLNRQSGILTMLLAAIYVFRPIAAMSILIVQQTTDAQLFRCSSIPARPIASARGLMTEYSIEPVAVFRSLRRI